MARLLYVAEAGELLISANANAMIVAADGEWCVCSPGAPYPVCHAILFSESEAKRFMKNPSSFVCDDSGKYTGTLIERDRERRQCRHCPRSVTCLNRGLCWKCYGDRSIRDRYPTYRRGTE